MEELINCHQFLFLFLPVVAWAEGGHSIMVFSNGELGTGGATQSPDVAMAHFLCKDVGASNRTKRDGWSRWGPHRAKIDKPEGYHVIV